MSTLRLLLAAVCLAHSDADGSRPVPVLPTMRHLVGPFFR